MSDTEPAGQQIDTFQLEGESAQAYAAFQLYLALPPPRSINAAYGRYKAQQGPAGPTDGPPRAPGTWKKWATKHRWEARARGQVARLHAVAQKAHEEAITEAIKTTDAEWAKRREALREQEFTVATQLLTKAKQMLAFPLVRKTTEENGQRIIFEPAKWSFSTAGQLIELASKLSRMAANLPLEIAEDPPDNLRDLMFQTSGQIAVATASGIIPEMPADVFGKPTISLHGGPGERTPMKPSKARPI